MGVVGAPRSGQSQVRMSVDGTSWGVHERGGTVRKHSNNFLSVCIKNRGELKSVTRRKMDVFHPIVNGKMNQAVVTEEKQFNDMLLTLNANIGEDEVIKLEKYCHGIIPKRTLERNAYGIFICLKEHGKITIDDTKFLKELLEKIGKTDLVTIVEKYHLGFFNFEVDLSNGMKIMYRGRAMMLGASGAGKTSTVRAVFGEPFEEVLDSTDGIKIFRFGTDWRKVEGAAGDVTATDGDDVGACDVTATGACVAVDAVRFAIC
ncbi:uncharacterized protein LOC144360405 [Saccoglossus kowalevskii]